MDRPPHTRREPRIREGTSRVCASGVPRQFILALLFALLLVGSSGCSILPMPGTAQPPPSGSQVVSFIDVGQGDAVLIQSGGKNYLIDGGKPEASPEVLDFLRSRGVELLDDLVATHAEADHIGGLPVVLDAFEVRTVYLSGDTKCTSTFNAFLRGVQDDGSQIVEARARMRMDWGGTTVDV